MACAGTINDGVVRSLFSSFDSNGDGAIDEGAWQLKADASSCVLAIVVKERSSWVL